MASDEKTLAQRVDEIKHSSDLLDRAIEAAILLEELSAITKELSEIRGGALRQLHNEGWSYAEIGNAVGLTRARVHQIVDR